MDPKFQTSFIPQKSAVANSATIPAPSSVYMTKTINIFNVIATVVFVVTILASGGLFAYKTYLTSQVAQASTSLTAARSSFDFSTIQNLINVSSRIAFTKQLLNNHVAVSGLFGLLQSLTVQKVAFSNLAYSKKGGELNVTMTGEAQGYDALAYQANVFTQNAFIQNPVFSNFDLNQDGNVTFTFNATIDPTLVSYKSAMASMQNSVSTASSTSNQ